jgi:uncharacterized membrane protein YhaH (DUF805 family)
LSYPQYPQQQTQPQQTQPQAWKAGEPPLWAPYYGASLPVAMKRFFKKYATFSGRASRSEYWWWALVSFIVSILLNVIMLIGGSAGAKISASGASVPGPGYTIGLILTGIWLVAVIVPSLALTVRRLHDVNFSGWMVLLGLVPLVGGIILLVFTLMDSKPEGQRFDVPGSV